MTRPREAGHVHDEDCGHDHDHDHHHVHDEHCGHDHDHDDHVHIHDHVAESGISSISLTSHTPIDGNRVTAWLNNVLQTQGVDILRAKGIIDVKGEERRLVFQAVHMILEGDFQGPWKDTDNRYSRLVFIGRNLDEAGLLAGFESCIAA